MDHRGEEISTSSTKLFILLSVNLSAIMAPDRNTNIRKQSAQCCYCELVGVHLHKSRFLSARTANETKHSQRLAQKSLA